VSLDYATLDTLRRSHPAWRLLLADHAPLVASFLQRVFVLPNVRGMAQAELVSKLEDELFHLRQSQGDTAFPKPAATYLEDWTQETRGWLRKYYPPGSDEAHFDLTPATEKAIAWLENLTQRAFVGTESRLMTVFELLRQMVEGSDANPEARIRELEKRKAEIDAEIARIHDGELALLDETALKDRFQQVSATARELLADFREVEQNFRTLDRSTRERIALWEGSKGGLLESIFGERDAIADSDQGKSFRAFWDFLMSPERQEELSALLKAVFELQAVRALQPDARLKRVHYDWLEAGEHTQRTVSLLSQQLRRFLDDQVWLENRRIMEIIHHIEAHALALREDIPKDTAFMEIDDVAPGIELPMERPLFSVSVKPVLTDQILADDDGDVTADALFDHVVVDKARLAAQLRHALQTRQQIMLEELLAEFPMEHGLAELVAYLTLASEDSKALFDEANYDIVRWLDGNGVKRSASLPRMIFNR
jgi:flagellar motility protein MotE (MotC chaperone)